MLQLHYAGESVLVSNAVGEAVLRYARALADTHSSDVVAIPVIEPGGEVARAEFLLGPASQLYSTPAPGEVELAADDDLVAELDGKTRILRPSARVSTSQGEATEFDSA